MSRIGARRIVLEPGDITFSPGGKVATRYALKESGQHLCLHVERPAAKGPKGPAAGVCKVVRLGRTGSTN